LLSLWGFVHILTSCGDEIGSEREFVLLVRQADRFVHAPIAERSCCFMSETEQRARSFAQSVKEWCMILTIRFLYPPHDTYKCAPAPNSRCPCQFQARLVHCLVSFHFWFNLPSAVADSRNHFGMDDADNIASEFSSLNIFPLGCS
jgi:hypothetical protein